LFCTQPPAADEVAANKAPKPHPFMTPTLRTTSSTGDAYHPEVEHQGKTPSPSLIPDRSEI